MTQTMTNEEFEQLLNDSYTHKLNVVDVVKGVIVKKEKDGYLVDIGSKTEAFLPNREITLSPSQNPEDFVKLWDEKEFYVMKDEEDDEVPVLSLKKLSFAQSWSKLNDARINNDTIMALVVSSVKGGLIAEVEGLRGFIPSSQLRAGISTDEQMNKEIEVKILEADPKRNKLILSQRQVFAQRREEVAQGVISQLNVDDVIEGEVVRIADFGVFVDISGIDGLLPISEISWDRIKHPSEVVSLGEKITVKVIKVDEELKRVSLSLKRMTSNPWDEIADKFQEGDVIDGTINKITNFGMFINIFPGVEALLPSAEISDEHVNLNNKYNVGDEIKVQIKKFTPEEHRIGLSIKEL
ncbi:MAG: S1 RNA-binding domain-containing protein [Cyanobacteria bacterium SIG30]|nr:S1 RNA-binding domain-containing protein [Cyanobacteria bacterium SIG30]